MIGTARTASVSIVIPALNEEKYLPRLLVSLRKQSFTPCEILVADGGSVDRTAEIACRFGCRVVPGGRPARGRNEGGHRACGEYILFLDADVKVSRSFLTELMGGVEARRLDAASGFISPDSGKRIDKFLVGGSNLFCYLVQKISPHAAGFYIVVRKSLHERIGGFNEELFVGEDHDYVSRASHMGRFRFLSSPRVVFSTRRFDKEGRALLLWKLFILEAYRICKKGVKREIVRYDFGGY